MDFIILIISIIVNSISKNLKRSKLAADKNNGLKGHPLKSAALIQQDPALSDSVTPVSEGRISVRGHGRSRR
jgi:hypothetical protein